MFLLRAFHSASLSSSTLSLPHSHSRQFVTHVCLTCAAASVLLPVGIKSTTPGCRCCRGVITWAVPWPRGVAPPGAPMPGLRACFAQIRTKRNAQAIITRKRANAIWPRSRAVCRRTFNIFRIPEKEDETKYLISVPKSAPTGTCTRTVWTCSHPTGTSPS